MKRRDLIANIEKYRCFFLREGANHTVYKNVANNRESSVPRHSDIGPWLSRKICKDLDIPPPRGK